MSPSQPPPGGFFFEETMTLFAIGAVLFGAVIVLFVLNDFRLHGREYDWQEVVLFVVLAAGGICSAASGAGVLL